MKSKTKIWLGVGAFVVAGTGAGQLPAANDLAARPLEPSITVGGLKDDVSTPQAAPARVHLAAAKEGGEGGEGGEAGIDVAAAANDPVEYGVALQVIAAHYYAGLAAYEAKEFEAGAQMFAHGLSEVYVEMEDILRQRGVTTLGKKLEAAVEGASAKLPPPQIRRRVRAALDALAAAEKASPVSAGRVQVTRAQVVANLLNRAATQYSVSLNDKNLEPYLDGLGFAVAARTEAAKILPWLRGRDKQKAAAISAALALAKQAYPGIRRPSAQLPTGRFLAASSSAMLAVSNWK
jgi:hypothetical protein